jgi:hypothetical protein
MCGIDKRYSGKGARILIPIFCVLTILLAVDTMYGLLMVGNVSVSKSVSPADVHLRYDPNVAREVQELMRRSREGH